MSRPADASLPPDVRRFLLGLKRAGVVPGLERVRALLAELGNPHEQVPMVHIAGTNGKGSVAAMLDAMLRAAGWRVGLYTSPHLIRLGERIQVGREPVRNAELAASVEELRPVLERLVSRHGSAATPTYFEFMTALAFRHFARVGCDVAVIEAGMGGRLDATNVIIPEISVITSIGLDHMEFLGGTLEAIAVEKSGIIKPSRPVVLGRMPVGIEAVLRARAAAHSAPVFSVADSFGDDPTRYPTTAAAGAYQRCNAATATLAARTLGTRWRISDAEIARGLSAVTWPGRWQRIECGGRLVVIDGAHNEEGARALDTNLAELRREVGVGPTVVVGVLGSGRAEPLLQIIARHAEEILLVEPRQRRACSVAELRRLVPASFRGRVREIGDLPAGLAAELSGNAAPFGAAASKALPPLVITGSLYLAGEALAALNPDLGPVEHELQDF